MEGKTLVRIGLLAALANVGCERVPGKCEGEHEEGYCVSGSIEMVCQRGEWVTAQRARYLDINLSCEKPNGVTNLYRESSGYIGVTRASTAG
jgi:hypothetical protein